jgi:hypothetical protein
LKSRQKARFFDKKVFPAGSRKDKKAQEIALFLFKSFWRLKLQALTNRKNYLPKTFRKKACLFIALQIGRITFGK